MVLKHKWASHYKSHKTECRPLYLFLSPNNTMEWISDFIHTKNDFKLWDITNKPSNTTNNKIHQVPHHIYHRSTDNLLDQCLQFIHIKLWCYWQSYLISSIRLCVWCFPRCRTSWLDDDYRNWPCLKMFYFHYNWNC